MDPRLCIELRDRCLLQNKNSLTWYAALCYAKNFSHLPDPESVSDNIYGFYAWLNINAYSEIVISWKTFS